MALSDVQAGRIGEYLLAVYAMLTSGGRLVPFQVDADDDHRDLVVAVKGASTFASLQSKACFQLGESGFVQSNATYFEDTVPRDPSLDRKSTRLNSSHVSISYAVFCLKKK